MVSAILTGHFVCTSRRHGLVYVDKDRLYPHTWDTADLCRAIAARFVDEGVDAVAAPEKGGIILSQWVAYHLTGILKREVLAFYAEKEEVSVLKTDRTTSVSVGSGVVDLQPGEEILIRKPSFVIKRGGAREHISGKRILVVEDVLTTGGSARKVIEAVLAMGGVVVGLGVLWNRGGVTVEALGNPPKVEALVSKRYDDWPEDACQLCAQGVPVNTDAGKGREFLERKGRI